MSIITWIRASRILIVGESYLTIPIMLLQVASTRWALVASRKSRAKSRDLRLARSRREVRGRIRSNSCLSSKAPAGLGQPPPACATVGPPQGSPARRAPPPKAPEAEESSGTPRSRSHQPAATTDPPAGTQRHRAPPPSSAARGTSPALLRRRSNRAPAGACECARAPRDP